MKRFFATICLFWGVSAASALAPQAPEVAAGAFVLVDMSSNQILAERNADAPSDPASLTKLMTAYVVFNAIREKRLTLEQTVAVSKLAWDERKAGGSLMFIDTTMMPKVQELLYGMIVQSGNDASVALAEAVGGTVAQFVAMMNRQAQAFGLKNTNFKNVTGLTEPGHTSTARDLSVIAARIIRDFPEFYSYYSTKEYKYNNITQPNRNLLLRRDPTIDGMKTGYTEAAGYCLIASAQRDVPGGKRRLLSVVLKTASMEARAGESQKLLNWGFQAFDLITLLDPSKALVTPEIWKGTVKSVNLAPARSVFLSVPRGDSGKLKTHLERTDPLVAPLSKGQAVGSVKVSNEEGVVVAQVPLLVMEPVDEASWFGRAWDAMRLWIK